MEERVLIENSHKSNGAFVFHALYDHLQHFVCCIAKWRYLKADYFIY